MKILQQHLSEETEENHKFKFGTMQLQISNSIFTPSRSAGLEVFMPLYLALFSEID
jgi:hypothetical protein